MRQKSKKKKMHSKIVNKSIEKQKQKIVTLPHITQINSADALRLSDTLKKEQLPPSNRYELSSSEQTLMKDLTKVIVFSVFVVVVYVAIHYLLERTTYLKFLSL